MQRAMLNAKATGTTVAAQLITLASSPSPAMTPMHDHARHHQKTGQPAQAVLADSS